MPRITPMVNHKLPHIDITMTGTYEDRGGKLGQAHLSTVHYTTYDFNIFVTYIFGVTSNNNIDIFTRVFFGLISGINISFVYESLSPWEPCCCCWFVLL